MEAFTSYGMPLFLEKILSDPSFITSSDAFEEISLGYRGAALSTSLPFKKEEAAVYASARMPATRAAINAVLERLKQEKPLFSPKSFLDLGAGPGSFLWAFLAQFQTFERGVLWEGNAFFLDLLRLFLKAGETSFKSLKNVEVVQKNILKNVWDESQESFDLVSLSYVLSEISPSAQAQILKNAWMKTREVLLLVEPGTPAGFSNITRARHILKEQGGFFCAPCPHENKCPLENTNDWCHFKVRLTRSLRHKQLKSASLSYEDEKYSYLIAQKIPFERNSSNSRILKNPLKRKGHIIFDVCTQKGEGRFTVSKKTPKLYKEAQKKEWGDLLSHEGEEK